MTSSIHPSSPFTPTVEDLSENERAWVGFLRLISNDTDPAPSLALVQALRQAWTVCGSNDDGGLNQRQSMFRLHGSTQSENGVTSGCSTPCERK